MTASPKEHPANESWSLSAKKSEAYKKSNAKVLICPTNIVSRNGPNIINNTIKMIGSLFLERSSDLGLLMFDKVTLEINKAPIHAVTLDPDHNSNERNLCASKKKKRKIESTVG
jgi:hypothetical protein